MGFGRTQHIAGQRTFNADIVGIATAAGQQPAVFLARRPVADAEMPFPAIHDARSLPTDERRPQERRLAANIRAKGRRGES